jgi:hypothetical protein
MATETLERWMPTNLDELTVALSEITRMVREEGVSCFDESTVYVDVRYLSLEKRTLTDGSVAYDLVVKANK